jgi:hypothetical protein
MIEQNIFFASSLAAFGGFLQVIAILALVHPEITENKNKNASSADSSRNGQSLVFNKSVQLFTFIINTWSTWYGPISTVVPIRLSAQLLSNWVIFGTLGIADFSDDIKMATVLVVSATTLLVMSTDSTAVAQGQDAFDLLHAPFCHQLWIVILSLCVAFTGFICLRFFIAKTESGVVKNVFKFEILLVARVSSSVLWTSLSKLLVSTSGYVYAIVLVAYFACAILTGIVAFLQATEVDQSLFVFRSSSGIVILNAFTGFLLWQDWRIMQSSTLYCIVVVQIVVGVYFISSLVSYSQSADTDYALYQSATFEVAKETAEIIISENPKLHGTTTLRAYAGGTVKAMLSGFIEEDWETTGVNSSSQSSQLSETKSGIDNTLAGLISDDDDSHSHVFERLTSFYTYGTVHTNEKFTESFV